MIYCLLFSIILILAIPEYSSSILVRLEGQQYARRHESITLNCSSDTVPIGFAAEILVNNKTYTSIRLSDGNCFSSIDKRVCLDTCSCSDTGKWYTYKLKVNLEHTYMELRVKCEMQFGTKGLIADAIVVRIIDIIGPEITSDTGFPLIAGRMTNLTCRVQTMMQDVSLQWDCLNKNTAETQKIDSTLFISVLLYKVMPHDDNKRCTCIATVEGFVADISVRLNITYIRFLRKGINTSCNSSSTVQLSCLVFEEQADFGFQWLTHSFNEQVIRSFEGKPTDYHSNSTSLIVNSCKYQDAGKYTCQVWNKHYEYIPQVNRSISLTVNSPPVITLSKILSQPEQVMFVEFYSPSDEVEVAWLHDGIQIYNSTSFLQKITRVNTTIQMYNQNVICEGFASKLFVKNFTSGKFEVKLKNVFGENSSSFTFNKDAKTFNIRYVIWVLTAIGIFVLTTTVTVVLSRQFSNIIHIVGPQDNSPGIPIYHSAPQSHNEGHTYDRTNPHYLELVNYETHRIYADQKEDNSEETSSGNFQHYEEIE